MSRIVSSVSVLSFALLLTGCSAASRLVVQPVRVEGTAMQPALKAGDRIFISRDVRELNRGDIIVFYHPKEPSKSYIKRIVGLPGETIEIRRGKVLINGSTLEESYVMAENNRQPSNYEPIEMPADNFYVLGDNRDYSNDSRAWGAVPRTLIYGKFMSKYAEAK